MTTAPPAPLAAVPDDPLGSAELPRTTYNLTAHSRYRGRLTRESLAFTALAMLDGGSMLNLVGGANDEQARALKAMLFRVTVDDDGIGRDVEARLLRDDEVSYAWLDGSDDDDGGADEQPPQEAGPPTIPDDVALRRMRKSELVALAEAHDLDAEGTNPELIAGLGAARDFLAESRPGTELATGEAVDAELLDSAARWRLVWPHDEQTPADEPLELAVEDEFDTREQAVRHGADHGSSLRRFAILLTDPDTVIPPDSLSDAVEAIAGAAANRPTRRSADSRRSRAARGRSRR